MTAALVVTLSIPASAPVGASGRTPVRHATPPAIGSHLEPQGGLFRCEDESGARASAETGFLARGCEPLVRGDTWRVVRCMETTLSHGPLRLVEVLARDGRHAWVPLPWHDWA